MEAGALRRRTIGFARLRELVLHLALREMASMHRFTLIGWLWPLIRQLAYVAVLVVIFTQVFDVGIENYAVFVFTGLIAWTWFSAGVSRATDSVLQQRHLLLQSRFPTLVLPVVAVAVPMIDVLIALPVLVGLLVWTDELHPSALFAFVLLAVQLLLMCGLAWLLSAANVYLRDVGQIVTISVKRCMEAISRSARCSTSSRRRAKPIVRRLRAPASMRRLCQGGCGAHP